MTLGAVAEDLGARLVLDLPARRGRPAAGLRRPSRRPTGVAGDDPLFFEYFHGDTGAGLGASHQTGWTGLVAKLLESTARRRAVEP